ncbi:3-hydroxyacyl-CoA dehydrogenase [Variovorax paradoxus]|uniref:3-hydroxyacyl-CoA dehydrogenase n=1 Tax=Variovorax paradoxus TaxID=34073 RepID=A0A5Q0M6H7_VARPD|nr:3-hydroxyacyl-CoA dehydrogenase NAD-binding domain-containing protein [Variovorax paradoxus]QFZ85123.1 3-hydroxyacyl-CoA dehydrogenase [Variovorax paradoxus]
MTNDMIRCSPQDVRRVAVIGTGSVGASWIALFLARGMQVIAHDPAPGAEDFTRDYVTNAWPALLALGIPEPIDTPLAGLRFAASAAQAAREADLVQENVPEKPDLKARVLQEIGEAAGTGTVIISSTGGIPPSVLQESCPHPERLVVVHPFNPSHLIPLVEVVGGKLTSPLVVDWAMAFARHLGKQPIRVNMEASGHMTNRLQMALVREAVACLVDGVASARDIDAAIRYGLGPRWMLMGPLLTMHLAGGPGGMQGILDHAGAAVEEWWTPRSQPRLTPEVKAQLVAAADEVSGRAAIVDWIRWRDENLVRVLQLQEAGRFTEPKPA